MVIAVTHENGNVGQHFGHAKEFKLYEVENGDITDSAVVNNYGEGGHEAACMLMDDYNVAVVICDNIGEGAINGLQNISVSVIPNVEGTCDDAVEAFLGGSLVLQMMGDMQASCSAHGDGGGCCGTAGAGCGGCAGCS